MNYYSDKYTEWKTDYHNEKLDMKYLREEMNKTILQLKNYDRTAKI